MKLCRKLPRNLQIYPQYASTLDMPSVNNWWIPDEFVTSSTGTDQPWRHHRLKSRYTRRLAPGCGCRGSGVAATWVKHDPISITTTRKRHGLAGLAYLSPIRVIRVPWYSYLHRHSKAIAGSRASQVPCSAHWGCWCLDIIWYVTITISTSRPPKEWDKEDRVIMAPK